MINDIIATARFVTDLAAEGKARKKNSAILKRALRIEIAANLNLLCTVRDVLESGGSVDTSTAKWLLSFLSISTITASLMNDPHYLQEMAGKTPAGANDKPKKNLIQDLESIIIKVTEMRAIAQAPETAPLPTIQWTTRIKNLHAYHLAVINALKEVEKAS